MPFAQSSSGPNGRWISYARLVVVLFLTVSLRVACYFTFPAERLVIPLETTLQVLFMALSETLDTEQSAKQDVFSADHALVLFLAYFNLDPATIEVLTVVFLVTNMLQWCRLHPAISLIVGSCVGLYQAQLNLVEDRGLSTDRWQFALSYCLGFVTASFLRTNAIFLASQHSALVTIKQAPARLARRLGVVNRFTSATAELVYSFTHFVGLRTALTAAHWWVIMNIDWQLRISVGAIALCLEMLLPSGRPWANFYFPAVLCILVSAVWFLVPTALLSLVSNGILSAMFVLHVGNWNLADVQSPRSTILLLALWVGALYVDASAQQTYGSGESVGFLRHKIAINSAAYGLFTLMSAVVDLINREMLDEIQQSSSSSTLGSLATAAPAISNQPTSGLALSTDDSTKQQSVGKLSESVDSGKRPSGTDDETGDDPTGGRDGAEVSHHVEKISTDSGGSGSRTGDPSDASEGAHQGASSSSSNAAAKKIPREQQNQLRRKVDSKESLPCESPVVAVNWSRSPPPDPKNLHASEVPNLSVPSNESLATSDASNDVVGGNAALGGSTPPSSSPPTTGPLTATMLKKVKKAAKEAEAARIKKEEELAAESERLRKEAAEIAAAQKAKAAAAAEQEAQRAKKLQQEQAAAAIKEQLARELQAQKAKELQEIQQAKELEAKEAAAKARENEKKPVAKSSSASSQRSTRDGPSPPVAVASDSPPPPPTENVKTKQQVGGTRKQQQQKSASSASSDKSEIVSPSLESNRQQQNNSSKTARPIMSIDGDEEQEPLSQATSPILASAKPPPNLESPSKARNADPSAEKSTATSADGGLNLAGTPPTAGCAGAVPDQLVFVTSEDSLKETPSTEEAIGVTGKGATRTSRNDDSTIDLAMLHFACTGTNDDDEAVAAAAAPGGSPQMQTMSHESQQPSARASATLLDKLMELVKEPSGQHSAPNHGGSSSTASHVTPSSSGPQDDANSVAGPSLAGSAPTAVATSTTARFLQPTSTSPVSDVSDSDTWKVLNEELGSMVEHLDDDRHAGLLPAGSAPHKSPQLSSASTSNGAAAAANGTTMLFPQHPSGTSNSSSAFVVQALPASMVAPHDYPNHVQMYSAVQTMMPQPVPIMAAVAPGSLQPQTMVMSGQVYPPAGSQQVLAMQQIMTQQGPYALLTLATGQQVAYPILYSPQQAAPIPQQQQQQQPAAVSYYTAGPSHHQYAQFMSSSTPQ